MLEYRYVCDSHIYYKVTLDVTGEAWTRPGIDSDTIVGEDVFTPDVGRDTVVGEVGSGTMVGGSGGVNRG
jgi:hypothetical protein